MTTGRKRLYLGYDGVLHHEDVRIHRKHGIYMAAPGHALFEWMEHLDELLAPHPDLEIVLATHWVPVRDFSFACKQLSPTLRALVIGATFHSRLMRRDEFMALPRGVQVTEDVSRRAPASWFAIDDDALDWPVWCRDRLVHTDGAAGISDPVTRQAIGQMLAAL